MNDLVILIMFCKNLVFSVYVCKYFLTWFNSGVISRSSSFIWTSSSCGILDISATLSQYSLPKRIYVVFVSLQQFTFKCKKLYKVNFSLFKNENTGLKQTPATSKLLYTIFHCFSHPNFGILNNKCPQHSNGSLNDLHQVRKVIRA